MARKATYSVIILLMVLVFEFVLFQIVVFNVSCAPHTSSLACGTTLYVPEQPPRGITNVTEWLTVLRPSLLQSYGFDQPIWIRLLNYFRLMLTFNFGYNAGTNLNLGSLVAGTVEQRLPYTAILITLSVLATLAIGTMVGLVSPARRGRPFGALSLSVLLSLAAVPIFAVAVLSQFWLLSTTGEFYSPLGNALAGKSGWEAYYAVLEAIILPFLVLTLAGLSSLFVAQHRAVLQTRKPDFMAEVTAGGLAKRTVLYRNDLRNALLPMAKMFGMLLAAILSWDLLVEVIFQWPGLGQAVFLGLPQSTPPWAPGDFALEQALVFVMSVIATVGFLGEGIARGIMDPRAVSTVED